MRTLNNTGWGGGGGGGGCGRASWLSRYMFSGLCAMFC